ncbi:hypothetical protein [Pollutimonas bauzanensis]|uniref:Uncharacterized protein n=1 Tax=Pollutimonas bauzanensis TaxID=658167 RepID=A0A1M5YI43_9BURK|nr:hypothetical protein [Pollutimonas bauzanensis]SHI11676.1 hypothetical protein SAMN04488135_109112 [Pollutimonas bauzanensis]
MFTRTYSRWKRLAQLRQDDAPGPPEPEAEVETTSTSVSQADADMAALIAKFHAIRAQNRGVQVVYFIGRWIARPILWWPVKYIYRYVDWEYNREVARRRKEEAKRRRRLFF